MASRRVDGRPVDIGAQYFVVRDDGFAAVVHDWERRGLARPWTDRLHVLSDGALVARPGPMRWSAADGLRSLVTDLARGIPAEQDVQVTAVTPAAGGGLVVRRQAGRSGAAAPDEHADVVVLAMPDPQAEALLDERLVAARAAVADRPWLPVITLFAGWPERAWPAFGGAFVAGSDALTFVGDDGSRRGDLAPVLVAHSTDTLARAHLADPQAALPALVAEVRALLDLDEPTWAIVHRWTYASPRLNRDVSFHLDDDGVGLCGDGWGPARVETAWLSGHRLAGRLLGEA
jgi:hypothetical protein